MMALGVYLNIPFAALGWIFAYPQVLREPAGTMLARFHAGDTLLLAVWYAFVLRSFDPGLAGIATPLGFIALSVWMVIAGFTLTRRQVPDTRRG